MNTIVTLLSCHVKLFPIDEYGSVDTNKVISVYSLIVRLQVYVQAACSLVIANANAYQVS